MDDIIADAAGVWDVQVLPDPDAAVNAVAQVLGKVAVDVFVNDRAGIVVVKGDWEYVPFSFSSDHT